MKKSANIFSKIYKTLWIISIVLVGLTILTIFLPTFRLELEVGNDITKNINVNGLAVTFGKTVALEFESIQTTLSFNFNYWIFIIYAIFFVILFGICYSYSTRSNAIATFVMMLGSTIAICFSKQLTSLVSPAVESILKDSKAGIGLILAITFMSIATLIHLSRMILFYCLKIKEKKEVYTREIMINSSLVDRYERLTLTGLLQLIQDISVSDFKNRGYKNRDLDSGKLHWVVASINLELQKLPKYHDTVFLSTYPQKTIHYIYPRQYILKSSDGKLLGRAVANWMIVNSEDKKATLPSVNKVNIEGYDWPNPLPFNKSIERKDIVVRETRRVRSSDIDLNNHLNNVKYAGFLLDTYPSSTFENKQIKTFTIKYRQEVLEGEMIEIERSEGSPAYFAMRNKVGEIIAEAELKF